MKLGLVAEESELSEGGILQKRQWPAGGVSIRVECSKVYGYSGHRLISNPEIIIGGFFESRLLNFNFAEFEAHLKEAKDYAAQLHSFMEAELRRLVMEFR